MTCYLYLKFSNTGSANDPKLAISSVPGTQSYTIYSTYSVGVANATFQWRLLNLPNKISLLNLSTGTQAYNIYFTDATNSPVAITELNNIPLKIDSTNGYAINGTTSSVIDISSNAIGSIVYVAETQADNIAAANLILQNKIVVFTPADLLRRNLSLVRLKFDKTPTQITLASGSSNANPIILPVCNCDSILDFNLTAVSNGAVVAFSKMTCGAIIPCPPVCPEVNPPAIIVNPTPVTVTPTPVTVNPTPVTVNSIDCKPVACIPVPPVDCPAICPAIPDFKSIIESIDFKPNITVQSIPCVPVACIPVPCAPCPAICPSPCAPCPECPICKDCPECPICKDCPECPICKDCPKFTIVPPFKDIPAKNPNPALIPYATWLNLFFNYFIDLFNNQKITYLRNNNIALGVINILGVRISNLNKELNITLAQYQAVGELIVTDFNINFLGSLLGYIINNEAQSGIVESQIITDTNTIINSLLDNINIGRQLSENLKSIVTQIEQNIIGSYNPNIQEKVKCEAEIICGSLGIMINQIGINYNSTISGNTAQIMAAFNCWLSSECFINQPDQLKYQIDLYDYSLLFKASTDSPAISSNLIILIKAFYYIFFINFIKIFKGETIDGINLGTNTPTQEQFQALINKNITVNNYIAEEYISSFNILFTQAFSVSKTEDIVPPITFK